jgi:hypothetical protein
MSLTLEQMLEIVNAIETKIIDANMMLTDFKGALIVMADAEEEAIEARGKALEAFRDHECAGDHVCNVCGKESND